jgi:hypothetical protein
LDCRTNCFGARSRSWKWKCQLWTTNCSRRRTSALISVSSSYRSAQTSPIIIQKHASKRSDSCTRSSKNTNENRNMSDMCKKLLDAINITNKNQVKQPKHADDSLKNAINFCWRRMRISNLICRTHESLEVQRAQPERAVGCFGAGTWS